MKPYHIATDTVYPNLKRAGTALGILGLTEASAPDHGIALAEDEPRPEVTEKQTASLSQKPTENEDGSWTFKWTVADKPIEQIHAEINRERDRRLEVGTTVTVTGYGDIPVQGRPQDQINLLALKDTARDLNLMNLPALKIPFRDANNVLHMLNSAQVMEMANNAKTAASAIYQVAWAMKDGTAPFEAGIPDNFTDDQWWTV